VGGVEGGVGHTHCWQLHCWGPAGQESSPYCRFSGGVKKGCKEDTQLLGGEDAA